VLELPQDFDCLAGLVGEDKSNIIIRLNWVTKKTTIRTLFFLMAASKSGRSLPLVFRKK
jgi:hypothetical protein